jgi:beta-lactamase superfamily II metal-dependent hydrolase
MNFTVHDVGHGACISLIHENGEVLLWDCGHSDQNRPSVFLPSMGISKITHFFITNYDQDHISDLPNLTSLNIQSIIRNKTISASQLRLLKEQNGPLTEAMTKLLAMIGTYTGGPLTPSPTLPGVDFSTYRNNYSDEVSDTNNLSLVTILNCKGTKILIPGDMETKVGKN